MQFGFRTFMFFALLLAMVVLSYPLLFKPLNAQREALILDTKQKEQTLSDLAGQMAQTKDMPKEVEKLKAAYETLMSKLPPETEMDKVLQQVAKAAQENQLNIKSVRNGKAVNGVNYDEQPIRMVIDGPFNVSQGPGFFRFLSQVEQMQRLTKIKQMKIDADEKNNGAITTDMELTVYYEPSQKAAVTQ